MPVGELTALVGLPGGAFAMGSDRFYPDEGPVHVETVRPLRVERHPVTNAQFAGFVADTGYVTIAERALDPALYPGVTAADLAPGALVFRPTPGPVDLRDWRQWWTWVPSACWRHPYGPGAEIADRTDHPVVQIAYDDATAYADWAGRRLPTEAEWEYAARAGTTSTYAWGEEPRPGGELMANTWQGRFPYANTGALGLDRDLTRRHLPGQRVRARGPDRQCLGVDDDALPGSTLGRLRTVVLCPRESCGPGPARRP